MPWWAWAIVVVAAIVALLVGNWWQWRRGVRRRFIAYLEAARPDMQVVRATGGSLLTRREDGTEGVMYLHRIYDGAGHADTPEEERRLFEMFVTAITEQERDMLQPLSLEAHGERLRPMLAAPEKRAQLPVGADLPHTPVESLGLEILYVLDGENSVSYLTMANVEELGLTVERLHERCLANLRATFPVRTVRDTMRQNALAMLKVADGYDATRLLLLPEYLEPGEVAMAMIPDRDTLAFGPAPENIDWRRFDPLARAPGGPHVLLRKPVRVTREGFQVM